MRLLSGSDKEPWSASVTRSGYNGAKHRKASGGTVDTREAIREAFMGVYARKRMDRITVEELCVVAPVPGGHWLGSRLPPRSLARSFAQRMSG